MAGDENTGHDLFNRFAKKDSNKPESLVWRREPPGIDEFITSKEFLGQLPLSVRQSAALHAVLGEDPKLTFENQELPLESVFLFGKGCLLGDQLITLADGREVTILDLIEDGEEPVVLSLLDQAIVQARASVPFFVGEGECFEVLTQSGRRIRCFEEHQFLTADKWETLSSLSVGDVIATVSENPQVRGPVYWDAIKAINPIGVHAFYDLEVEATGNYIAEGIFNHNSGKDLISSYIISYLCYLVCLLIDPHKYFGLAHGENIDIVNVATNAQQSRQVFFSKLKSRLNSRCFKEFGPVLGATMVRFPAINLRLHSVHAANESWEGLNILAWVMDEASAFRAAGGNADNSGAVYSTLRTSANSRFASMRWIGLIISFPRKQVNDFTLSKYIDAQTSPTMFGDKGATWDINPQYDPTHPLFKNFEWVVLEDLNVRIPKPFVEEFLKDPTDCKTKYMCEPPPQIGGFFEIPRKLDECVDRELPQIVTTSQLVRREVRGMQFDYVSRIVDQVPPRVDGGTYYLHGDPGLVSDAFSICVCHTLPEEKWIVDLETGDERKLRRVVVDFVLNWEPTSTTPVDLNNVTDTIERFARYYGIQRVTFDRWNSATSIQSLIERGIFAEDLSFSGSQQLQMYRNLKLLVYNSLITWPDDPDILLELKFLKLENNKVTHDAYGKDRADAIAAAAWSATGEELSLTQQLVMQTIGDFQANRNADGGHTTATLNWR